jgi:RNA ligase
MVNVSALDLSCLDIEEVKREIVAGYINVQSHPTAPLRILNYTNRAKYDSHWNSSTIQCRGLIVDERWNVIARPFPKFFNTDQIEGEIPSESFDVYEKLDGSLGILYRIDGVPYIATRGSFAGEQAVRATEIYRRKYSHVQLDDSMTYLFEIIYPENRIVVDYGDMEDLILLAVIDTETGADCVELPGIGFPVVKKYDGVDQFDELMALNEQGREGFVVRFRSRLRVKIKFEQYKIIHRLVTWGGPKEIWQMLREGQAPSKWIGDTPDEFFAWIKETESYLVKAYKTIEEACKTEINLIRTQLADAPRKDYAERIRQGVYPSVLFAMLDDKPYADPIWKLIQPNSAGKPFRHTLE